MGLFDFVGDILGFGEPSVPAPPGFSPQETELMGLQADWLRWQMEQAQGMAPLYQQYMQSMYDIAGQETALRDELMPFLLESMGLRRGEGGEIERIPDELGDLYREKQLAALRGDYTSPALETQLTRQRGLMGEGFARKYGSDWQGTTAGQKGLTQLGESENLLREQARLNFLGMGQGLMGQYAGMVGAGQGQQYGQYGGLGTYGFQNPSGLQLGFGGALQPYQAQRGMQYQGALTQAQLGGQQQAGLMGLLGNIGGMALGGWLSRPSPWQIAY